MLRLLSPQMAAIWPGRQGAGKRASESRALMQDSDFFFQSILDILELIEVPKCLQHCQRL